MDLAWKGCVWERNEKKRPAGDVKESQQGNLRARCAADYMDAVLACWSKATRGGSPSVDGWSGMSWTAAVGATGHLGTRLASTFV